MNKLDQRLLDSRKDLEGDLKRNQDYFNDENDWGGSEEAQEKEAIRNHINWIKRRLALYDELGID